MRRVSLRGLLGAAFLVLIVVGLGAGAVAVLRSGPGRSPATVEYRLLYSRLNGLRPDSEVRMLGLPVGRVKGCGLRTGADGRLQAVVRIEVEPEYAPLVRVGSAPAILPEGLFGKQWIELQQPRDAAGSKVAAPGTELRGQDPPDVSSFFARLEERASRVEALVDQTRETQRKTGEVLDKVMAALDDPETKRTRENLTRTVNTIGGCLKKWDKTKQDVREFFKRLGLS